MADLKSLSRRDFLKGGAGLLAGAVLGGCAPETSPPVDAAEAEYVPGELGQPACLVGGDEVDLRLLWTGDTHGQLRPIYHRDFYGESFLKQYGIQPGSPEAYLTTHMNFNDLAAQYGKVGGYAHIATLVRQERELFPDRTLLLDSGDAIYGSAITLLTEGRAAVQVMNAMGYDALTLHWELNLGKEAFLARVDEADFEVLAQNLVDTDFEDRILAPSMIREMGGLRVGIVGEAYPFSLLTTEDRDANPGMRMGYREVEMQEEIDRLRNEEMVDVLILLSHMGYEQDRAFANILHGVDVIVGAHSHDILWQPELIGDTILLQGGSHGKFLGRIDLQVRDRKVTGCRHALLPVLADRIEPDPEIEALIDTLYQPFEGALQREIGEAGSTLYRRSLFGGTTDKFLTVAYKEIVGADLGCSSGWRFGSTILPGPIRVEDVYNAMKPTPSPIYKASLAGRRIREIIEDNLDNVFNPDPLLKLGGDVTRCTGMTADLNRSAARLERTTNLEVNGKAFDPEKIYTVGTSGGRTQYQDPESSATSGSAVDELVSYIEAARDPVQAGPIAVFSEKN